MRNRLLAARRRSPLAERTLALVMVVGGLSGLGFNVASSSAASLPSVANPPSSNLGFTPLPSPIRIADTRSGAADPSTYAGDTLSPGGELTIDIPSADVPSDAGAIVAQLSAVSPSGPGYLSIYPAGSSAPSTSNVNFVGGQDVGNLVTVGVGTDHSDGALAVTVLNGPSSGGPDTDITLDLSGYYAPKTSTSGAAYTPLVSSRIFDTRSNSGEPGQGETLTNGGSVQVPVTGAGGVPSSGVSAVVVNIGVTNTSAPSFIQAYPTGSPPSSSTPTVNQNWVAGETLSTKAIIGVGADGSITLANHDGNVDVVVDVDGYFGNPGGSGSLLNVLQTPVRLVDTRPTGVIGGGSVPITVEGNQGVPSAIPSQPTAAVLDIVDISNGGNFLTAYPVEQFVPLAADVNYAPGDTDSTVANSSYATAGGGGAVYVYNGPTTAAATNVVIDEFGYFALPLFGPGIANLTYNGVLSGQLANAVSYCQPLPNAASDIIVNGTLNGTPWVLLVQSYDGESGVWQVVTGQAGGGSGLVGEGYADDAAYPATLSGVTVIDWAQGATLDVQLTSNPGQTPAGTIAVQGTVSCG